MAAAFGRAMQVFDALGHASEPLPLPRLAEATGINRVSLGRLLSALVSDGLLAVDEGGRYRLTLALLGPGLLALRQRQVRDIAFPLLVDLSADIGNEVSMGFIDYPNIVFVDSVFVVGGRVSSRIYIGTRPLLESHTGRLLLAFHPRVLVDELLATPGSLSKVVGHPTESDVLTELEKAKADGYLTFDRDPESGSPAGISVPVFDGHGRATAGIVITRPTSLDEAFLHDALAKLLHTSRRISLALGSRPEAPLGHI